MATKTTYKPINSESIKSYKSDFFTSRIKAAPENDLLYEPFGVGNPDDWDLVNSIRDQGVHEPLILSADYFLLSGHRRLAAIRYLRILTAPVSITDIIFAELSKADRLSVLRSHNQQREKNPGEKIREQLLLIDPNEAYERICRHRAEQLSGISIANVDLGNTKKRARITTTQFLIAAQKVIEDNKEYWPLTLRRIHYLLLNNPPLRHNLKLDSQYENDRNSYQALASLLIRARLNKDVPMRSIEDTTRPIQLGGGFASFEMFIKQESKNFLLGYSRNLMQGQPNHIEIMLEKNALRSIIEKVARDYCIPVTTGRGFSSLSPRYDLYSRFKLSGKKRLVLLMLTDFDPDGEQIASSFARSMRDDFGLKDIHAVKVALTAEDVGLYDLPSDLDAKPSSPNYRKFVEKYGTKAVELDAAPVSLLQEKLREAIDSVMDGVEFNSQIDMEIQDAGVVEAYRQTVIQSIGGSLHV